MCLTINLSKTSNQKYFLALNQALKRRAILAFSLVALYVGHGYMSIQTETEHLCGDAGQRAELHPILKLGAATFIHIDPRLVITANSRVVDDYKRMGLKEPQHSLHYRQSSGYSHAIDIRVKNRSPVRNLLMKSYFSLMGFNTLRHEGTADHLHVSLTAIDKPKAI